MSEIQYIREKVPQAELLAQLAEEASELAQAALKLRRVYDGTNPTPVKRTDAFDNLLEEIADVRLSLLILQMDERAYLQEYQKIMDNKLHRWADRLHKAESETGITDKRGRMIHLGDIIKSPFCGRKLHDFVVRKDEKTGKILAVPLEDDEMLWPFDLTNDHEHVRIVKEAAQ